VTAERDRGGGDALFQRQGALDVATDGPGLYEITRPAAQWVAGQGVTAGLVTLFCRHTSASLLIQENADPDVARDIADYFARLAPEDEGRYRHRDEGPDDMPAHLRAALTQTHLQIPVAGGKMALGTWQGIFLFEHRRGKMNRTVVMHLIGAA